MKLRKFKFGALCTLANAASCACAEPLRDNPKVPPEYLTQNSPFCPCNPSTAAL